MHSSTLEEWSRVVNLVLLERFSCLGWNNDFCNKRIYFGIITVATYFLCLDALFEFLVLEQKPEVFRFIIEHSCLCMKQSTRYF